MANNGGAYTWSKTQAANATADSTVNWQEGQAPSTVNDSARNMMASAAKFRDDISGAIVTTGISVAYIVASNQTFDTLANFAGKMIAFTPHITNGAGPVTMTVDGFANLPVRAAPGVELTAGTLIQGTPYTATYSGVDGVLYLHGFYGNPYNIPLAAGMPYFATATPNSSFVFPFGQAVSRSVYSALYVILATNFGPGDGTTTFNLPDLRGRVPAGWDAMGGVSANRLTAASGFGGLFSASGAETVTLLTANLPAYTPSGTAATASPYQPASNITAPSVGLQGGSAVHNWLIADGGAGAGASTVNFTGAAQGGTSAAVRTVMPALQCNYIMRII